MQGFVDSIVNGRLSRTCALSPLRWRGLPQAGQRNQSSATPPAKQRTSRRSAARSNPRIAVVSRP